MPTNTRFQNPITTKVTFPASVALAGYTLNSDDTIVTVSGTPVDPTTQSAVRLLTREGDIKVGDYIYDASQDEMREILSISYSHEKIHINRAFTAPLAATAMVIIPRSDLEELSLCGKAGTATIIDADDNSSDLDPGQVVGWKKDGKDHGENGFVGPLIVDASGGGVEVSVQSMR